MNVQRLERTLADKVFALCDYYMQGKTKRYSRHMYDIYMLLSHVTLDEDFRQLVKQVREHRAGMHICPSAVSGVDIPELLNEIVENGVYRKDYADITTYFQNHPVSYEQAAEAIRTVAGSGMFE